MTWQIKSQSDTDTVWAEVDDDGNETGVYNYDLASGVQRIETTPELEPERRLPITWLALAAGTGAVIGGLVEALVRG